LLSFRFSAEDPLTHARTRARTIDGPLLTQGAVSFFRQRVVCRYLLVKELLQITVSSATNRANPPLLPAIGWGWSRNVASPVALLLLWQLGSASGVIPAAKLAAPSAIVRAGWTLALSGALWNDLIVSVGRVAVGATIGIGLGVVLALAVGLWKANDVIVDPVLQMLRTLPYLGMTPLLILWFGIGEAPKIALVAFASLFPVYLTLLGGIRAVDPKLLEAARVFGLTRWETVRDVILPGSLAPALVGLRYALGAAWLSLVVGEQINADRGIGYLIMDARDFLRTDIILLGLLLYAVLGLATDAIVRQIEARALVWRPVSRATTR
jgi:sulfonate transport system permease protein